MATSNNTKDDLSPRKQRAIACLLVHSTIQKAAKAAGIGERTLHTWLKDPIFRAALSSEESMLISTATRRLVALVDKALDTFESVLKDQAAVNTLKLRASTSVLEYLLKLRELTDLEQRISTLEAEVKEKEKNR